MPKDKRKQEQARTNLDESKKKFIDKMPNNFSDYDIREMVKESENIGTAIAELGLKTNQIRKFLDAVNRIKSQLAQHYSKSSEEQFQAIEGSIVLLKPQLAYAAARKGQGRMRDEEIAAVAFKDVISKAIDHTQSVSDFEMLAKFVESVIAYHKAAGGQ